MFFIIVKQRIHILILVRILGGLQEHCMIM